jgi:DNA-binding transcriptional LysR family regulator
MKVASLRYFVVLSEERQFSKAAARCGVAHGSLTGRTERREVLRADGFERAHGTRLLILPRSGRQGYPRRVSLSRRYDRRLLLVADIEGEGTGRERDCCHDDKENRVASAKLGANIHTHVTSLTDS